MDRSGRFLPPRHARGTCVRLALPARPRREPHRSFVLASQREFGGDSPVHLPTEREGDWVGRASEAGLAPGRRLPTLTWCPCLSPGTGPRGPRVPEAREAALLLQARRPQGLLCCRSLSWSPPGLEAASQGLRRLPREGGRARCAAHSRVDAGRHRASSGRADAVSPAKLHPRMHRTGQRGPGHRPYVAASRPSIPGHLSASECPFSGRAPAPQRGWRRELRSQSPAMPSAPSVAGAAAPEVGVTPPSAPGPQGAFPSRAPSRHVVPRHEHDAERCGRAARWPE